MATARGSSLLICGLCQNPYSITDLIPKVLPCGHSFCNNCLENRNVNGRLICPSCDVTFEVPRRGVQGSITNHSIIDMLDHMCEQCQRLCQVSILLPKSGPSPIECGVCMEPYSLTNNVPKALPCGHTFCNVCLTNFSGIHSLTCPVCKQLHDVPGEGVQGFATNHAIAEMLDECSGRSSDGVPCSASVHGHVHFEYMTLVSDMLNEVRTVKEEQLPKFESFVDEMRIIYQELGDFCDTSKGMMKIPVDLETLNQVKARSEQYAKMMDSVSDFIAEVHTSVMPCLQTAVPRKSSSEFSNRTSESTSFLTESSIPSMDSLNESGPLTKQPTTTHTELVEYSSTPYLVLGGKGQRRGEFQYPQAAIVHANSGEIYITDGWNKRICIYNKNFMFRVTHDMAKQPRDVCFTTDGELTVTCDDNRIRIFNKLMNRNSIIGRKGAKRGEFDNPWGLAFDINTGMLYVCDSDNHRVQVFHESRIVRILDKLDDPRSIAIHPQTGHAYVADYTREQVNIYNHDGHQEACIRKSDIPGVKSFWPQYVSFRSDGLLCISDQYNQCIHLVRDGRVVQRIGHLGAELGAFNGPRGTIFIGGMNLLVCDTNNHRFQLFALNDH